MLRDDALPVSLQPPRDLLRGLSLDLSFHSLFGRVDGAQNFGRSRYVHPHYTCFAYFIRVGPLSSLTTTTTRFPPPFNFYLNLSLPEPINQITWVNDSASSFDMPLSNLPPSEGFLALNLVGTNTNYVTMYESKVLAKSDSEVCLCTSLKGG